MRWPTLEENGEWHWGFALALIVVIVLGGLGMAGYIERDGQTECEERGGMFVDIPQAGRHCVIEGRE